MQLIPISERPDRHSLLWMLLAERDPWMNISHKAMPTWEEHVAFVDRKPYLDWCFIDVDGDIVGSIYLTHLHEIGIFIFKARRGARLGPKAVWLMMEKHGPRRYLANVAPDNAGSAVMFANLGFKIIQRTYALEPTP